MKKRVLLELVCLLFIFAVNVFAKGEVSAPISLTASDGTGLQMTGMQVSCVVDGITAFTEIKMKFFNPENRVREGRFSILLSPEASISRFAMKIDDYWQEGEIVEKQKARRVYEDFLHRKQDPALLEQDSGNYFNARVFPIPANAEKELIISYSEILKNTNSTYLFPLKGLPKLDKFGVKAFYKGENEKTQSAVSSLGGEITNWKVLEVNKKDYLPEADFSLTINSANQEVYALRNKNLCVVKFKPIAADTASIKEDLNNWVVLFDTSASQSMNYADNCERLGSLFELLINTEKNTHIKLYAFDQDVLLIGDIKNIEEKNKAITALKQRIPLGASNFENTLIKLKNEVKESNLRLLIVSDGVPTSGEENSKKLNGVLKSINNILRTDCISFSAYKDEGLLNDLALSSSNTGKVLNEKYSNDEIIRKLLTKTSAKIEVNIPGAEWFWPQVLESFQAGDEAIVFANIPENTPFKIEYSGKTLELNPLETEYLLLKREWVKSRIEKLVSLEDSATDKDMKNAFHNQVIELSEKERVLCSYTALLVLETENDYRRYNIDRNSLTDILTIGAGGIEVIERKGREGIVPIPVPMPAIEEPVIFRSENITGAEPPLPQSKAADRNVMASSVEDFKDSPHEEAEKTSNMDSIAGESKQITSRLDNDAADEARLMERTKERSLKAEERVGDEGENKASDSGETGAQKIEPESPVVVLNPDTQQQDERVSIITIHVIPQIQKEEPNKIFPWVGEYKELREIMLKGNLNDARQYALNWKNKNPADALALVGLGEVEAKIGNFAEAGRAYGSLIDLFPSRADIRRWAAERLMEINTEIVLAVDCLKKAKEQRKDHPSVYHLLSIALLVNGEVEEAINVLTEALNCNFDARYGDVKRIFAETIGLILSSQNNSKLLENENVKKLIRKYSLNVNMNPEMRFIMIWETDVNDVDFHIYDGSNNHASYQATNLKTGGNLYGDITQGYGPECFRIENPKAYPYKLQAHYYSRGPMGYGMGLVQIIRFSDSKKLTVENRPFIIMQDQAFIDLGEVK